MKTLLRHKFCIRVDEDPSGYDAIRMGRLEYREPEGEYFYKVGVDNHKALIEHRLDSSQKNKFFSGKKQYTIYSEGMPVKRTYGNSVYVLEKDVILDESAISITKLMKELSSTEFMQWFNNHLVSPQVNLKFLEGKIKDENMPGMRSEIDRSV